MGRTYGLIAGSGPFPFFLLEEAARKGDRCFIAGIKGEADPQLWKKGESYVDFDLFQIDGMIDYFRSKGINEVFFGGKIDHGKAVQKMNADPRFFPLADQVWDKNPVTLIRFAIGLLAAADISVLDPSPFLAPALCEEGVLGTQSPSADVIKDIEFGWERARILADMDIGQTVVVKNRAVAAVEGMEGTDEAILRAGELAGKGTVVIKVCRKDQDRRIDLPAVGLKTILSMIEGGASALCIEAGAVPFFQKDRSLELADANTIAVVCRK